MDREERLKFFKEAIDKKRKELIEHNNHVNIVSSYIKLLDEYLDNNNEMDDEDIDGILYKLSQYRIDSLIPIDSGLLIRAVKQKDEETRYSVPRMSYIPLEQAEEKSKLGRFNNDKESMYYGCFSVTSKEDVLLDDDLVNLPVSFKEARVEEGNFVNVLRSKIYGNLNVKYIGLFYYFDKEGDFPFSVHEMFKDIHHHYENTHSKDLLSAIKLCDKFFTKITTSEGNDRLYKVTSILGSIFLEDTNADGLIYPSIESMGEPNIVLKPRSFDRAVVHVDATLLKAIKDEGNGKYRALPIRKGFIEDGNIDWKESS